MQLPNDKYDKRQALGKQGEEMGSAWLARRGMRILERNFRCRIGEIDLIGQIGDTLVFVEIRSRSSDSRGTPAETVNFHKRQRLRRLAAWYISAKGREESACRFDVVSILFAEPGIVPKIEWIPDAF